MSNTPKWKKVKPGHYKTEDGYFEVKQVTSLQTGRRTEVVWEIKTPTCVLPYCEETLRDAKQVVSRYY